MPNAMIKTAIQLPARFDDRTLTDVRDAGFDAVAISFYGCPDVLTTPNWRDSILRLREKLEHFSLPCVQTHLPCYAIRRSSEEPNAEEHDAILHGIEATSLLGSKWGAWHPRTDFSHHFDRDNAFRDNVRELTGFLETAEKFGAGIAVENLPVFPDDREVLFYTSDYHDLIRVVDALSSPLVGICWDTGHANLMHFSQTDALHEIGSRLRIVHLDDNLKNADVHMPPSIGTIDWKSVAPALRSTGFSGAFTLEVRIPSPMVQCSYYLHCGEVARMLASLAE